MVVRSVQRAVIHETNLRQSGTALFLVKLLVFQVWHSLSNNVLALLLLIVIDKDRVNGERDGTTFERRSYRPD